MVYNYIIMLNGERKMKKHLFLMGSMGSEKSEILRRVLGSKLMYAGGFVTDMALDENGMLLGLELFPAAAAGGAGGFIGERFLDCREFPPSHDNEVFRNTGVRLLHEAEYYPFAVLDEFGGYETVIPQYRQALFELLQSELPCIGTLKPADEADMMRQSLGLGDRVNEHIDALWALLNADENTMIIDLDDCTEKEAEKAVTEWREQYC